MATKKRGFPYELVGEEVCIVKSTHQDYVGIRGKVVDETKSTLRIEQQNKIKTVLKSAVQLQLLKSDVIVDGKILIKRSDERLK